MQEGLATWEMPRDAERKARRERGDCDTVSWDISPEREMKPEREDCSTKGPRWAKCPQPLLRRWGFDLAASVYAAHITM